MMVGFEPQSSAATALPTVTQPLPEPESKTQVRYVKNSTMICNEIKL